MSAEPVYVYHARCGALFATKRSRDPRFAESWADLLTFKDWQVRETPVGDIPYTDVPGWPTEDIGGEVPYMDKES